LNTVSYRRGGIAINISILYQYKLLSERGGIGFSSAPATNGHSSGVGETGYVTSRRECPETE